MASASSSFRLGDHALFLLLLAFLSLARHAMGAASPSRRLMELYKPPPSDLLRYHDGAVLSGDILVSVLWYGRFTPAQKAIVTDFLLSLSAAPRVPPSPAPSVSQWWGTIDRLYLSKADAAVGKNGAYGGKKNTRVVLAGQVSDEGCSLGKSLKLSQLPALAAAAARPAAKGGLALVLTAQDVAVEGFCMSRCGHHGSYDARARPRPVTAYAWAWVGNPATQCPGQCAWPFHQPPYGPQAPPLVPPNGDVGMDGAVISVASMVAGAVTNPFGDGFYQGDRGAPLEAATARARTPGTRGSCWWTRRRVPATTRTGRAGGSTCSPRCTTPTRVPAPPWFEETRSAVCWHPSLSVGDTVIMRQRLCISNSAYVYRPCSVELISRFKGRIYSVFFS